MTNTRSDDAWRRVLIPKECRPLYESLIDKGARPADAETISADPVAQALLNRGLVSLAPSPPPKLAPVDPTAAFTRVLTRWLDLATRLRHDIDETCRYAVAFHYRVYQLRMASGSACELITEKPLVSALHSSLTHAAEHEICNWVTGPYGEPPPGEAPQPNDVSPKLYAYLPPDPQLLRRGGIARSVHDSENLRVYPQSARDAFRDGENVRVRQEKLPMKLLIVDNHTVLVPLGPYGPPALLIRSKPLVALFRRFFDLVWDDAEPWKPDGETTPHLAPKSNERVLELMVAGLKDEAIARHCGVSVKTVRRQIAVLMRELGARNRFAAGVAAVRRGWVTPAA